MVKNIDYFMKERFAEQVSNDVVESLKRTVKVKNLHHGTDEESKYIHQWEDYKGRMADDCANLDCPNYMARKALVGAHVKKVGNDRHWYIVPLCHVCNSDDNDDEMRVREIDLVPCTEITE